MERHRHAVEPDRYDVWAYLRLYPALTRLIAEGKEVLPFFPFLLEDIFRALYKEVVLVRGKEELFPAHQPQREVLEILWRQGWFGELRQTTMLHEEKAIVATELIGRALLDLNQGKGASKEGREALSSRQLGQQLRQMVEEMVQERESQPTEIEASEGSSDREREQELEPAGSGASEEKEEERRGIKEEFKDRIESAATPLKRQRRDTERRKANEEEVGAILGGLEWGLGEGGYHTAATEREFAEALTWMEELRRFARALGRLLQTSFRKQLERLPVGAEEIYEVEQGRDLRRVLSSELVKLAHPFLRKLFWLSYAKGDLLLYKLRSRVPLGKGSKIFLIDLSWSTYDQENIRQGLEKLIALALLLHSKKGETYCAIYFQDDDPTPPVLMLDNPPTVEQWMDLATRYGTGGTNVVKPFRVAFDLIENDPRFRKADIVLITDGKLGGYHTLDLRFAEWLDRKKRELGVTILTVLVDWLGLVDESDVLRFSDRTERVTSLLAKKELREISSLLAKPRGGPSWEGRDGYVAWMTSRYYGWGETRRTLGG